jgi:pilus assembly protein CpaE
VLVVSCRDARVEQAQEVLRKIEEPALEVAVAELGEQRLGTQADVEMVLVGDDEQAALNFLHQEAGETPRPALFALLAERSQASIRRALRAGADEVLFLPLAQEDLMRPLLKLSETRRRSARRAGGRVSSLTSLGGGVGVSTLCANLGLLLQGTDGARVALFDLDLQEGGLGHLLGAESDRGVLALARLKRKPDSITLETALTRHASGLRVLGAPLRIEDSEEVGETIVSDLIDLMRQLFDYVVIDCGGHVDENAVAAWEHSQEVLYVLDQSIAATHRASRFLELFGRLGIDGIEPRLVINRYEPGHPVAEARIVDSLKCPVYARIPRDERAMEKSAVTGRLPAQVAPHSPMIRACEELARRLRAGDDVMTATETRPGLVTRLLSSFGARA